MKNIKVPSIQVISQGHDSFGLVSALKALSLLDTFTLEKVSQAVHISTDPELTLSAAYEFERFSLNFSSRNPKESHFTPITHKPVFKSRTNRTASAPCVILDFHKLEGSLDGLESMSQSKSDISNFSQNESISLREIELPSSPISSASEVHTVSTSPTMNRDYSKRKRPVRRWRKKEETELETPMKLLNPSEKVTTKRNNLNAIWIQDEDEIRETLSEYHAGDYSKTHTDNDQTYRTDFSDVTHHETEQLNEETYDNLIKSEIKEENVLEDIGNTWDIRPDTCDSPVPLVRKYSFEGEVPILDKQIKKEMTFSAASFQAMSITELTDTSISTSEKSHKTISIIISTQTPFIKPVFPIDLIYSPRETPKSIKSQNSYLARHKNSIFSELSISSFEGFLEHQAPVYTNESESPNTLDYSSSLISDNISPKESIRSGVMKYPFMAEGLTVQYSEPSENGKSSGWESPMMSDIGKQALSPLLLPSPPCESSRSISRQDTAQEDFTHSLVRSPVSEGTEELLKNTEILQIRISEIREKLNSIQLSDSSLREPLFTFMDTGAVSHNSSMALEMDEGIEELSVPISRMSSQFTPEHHRQENDETKTVTLESFKESIIAPVYKEILLLEAPFSFHNTEAGSPHGRNGPEWKVTYEEGKSCKCETCVLL
jgi:hypothetical protein